MLRIFLVSSHLSAILQSIYAASTKKVGDTDVLVIDYPPQKKALTRLILDTSFIHKWDKQLNYSIELTDDTNMKPSLKKRFIRKAKLFPIAKNVYATLLKRYMRKFYTVFEERIAKDLQGIGYTGVQLNLLTKTGLNEVFFKLYPQAEVNYFEHGMGDYMYFSQNKIRSGNFYCIFSDEFSAYLKKRDHPNGNRIRGYLNKGDFENAVKRLVEADVIKYKSSISEGGGERIVFVLLENVEMYQVSNNFWTDYLDICLSKITDPNQFTFIIKPHPSQSFDAIAITKKYFDGKNLRYIIFENAENMNSGAEVMFYFTLKQTEYVFSMFSSGIYYLSKLFPGNIKYYYGYRLFAKYTKNSPKQFTDIYKGIDDVVNEVLSKNCLEL